jgi:hypothetical protein
MVQECGRIDYCAVSLLFVCRGSLLPLDDKLPCRARKLLQWTQFLNIRLEDLPLISSRMIASRSRELLSLSGFPGPCGLLECHLAGRMAGWSSRGGLRGGADHEI